MMKPRRKNQTLPATFNRTLGIHGESIATSFLEIKGYKLLVRNFRTQYGEIDIIAQKNNMIIFAEVKLRKRKTYCTTELVPWSKQKKIISTAQRYITQLPQHIDMIYRFDIILVGDDQCLNPEITHIENAFFGQSW